MDTVHTKNWKHLVYQGYCELLEIWDWEWFATLSLPIDPPYIPSAANRLRLRWTRNLCTEEGIQVAYYYVLTSTGDYLHFHLVMLGRGHFLSFPITLKNVSCDFWERRWPYLAKIEIPRSLESVARYLARHEASSKYQYVELDRYNGKLLAKLKGSLC